MFKLIRAWDAERDLAPEDFQYILTPTIAFEQARIHYDVASENYHYSDPRISCHDVPRRKQGHITRFGRPDQRHRSGYQDEVYDNTSRNLDMGWLLGIDTFEDWDGLVLSITYLNLPKQILPFIFSEK